MYKHFSVDTEGKIVVIALNRPEKRNPINEEMLLDAARDFATRLVAKNPRAVTGSKLAVNAIAAVAARELTTVQPELFIHTSEN